MNMLSVLVNAYAVSPSWGSEPGMGWNWVSNLARYCDLHIITEGEWQKEIEQSIAAAYSGNYDKTVNPTGLSKEQAEHMHFYYVNVSPEVRKMCWNQGTWKFYFYYAKWEKRALQLARQIIKDNHIDIVHKLNMIGYREPGYMWKIDNLPYVWGPIGGYGGIPLSYLRSSSVKTIAVEILKNVINFFMFRLHPRVICAAKRADALVGAYKETNEAIKKVYCPSSVLINETGAFVDNTSIAHLSNKESFDVLWVGKYDIRKQLGIAIRTMEILRDKKNIHLWVVGTGYQKDTDYYNGLVSKKELENVHFLGQIPNVQTREMMKSMDLFLFTSVHDATSTVVPEAISAGLPVLCHDMRGYGSIVDESVGRKIKPKSQEKSAASFAGIIDYLEEHREEVHSMSQGCIERQKDISWEENARRMMNVYNDAVNHFNLNRK